MEFLREDAVPARPGDTVFREARLGKLAAFAIFLSLTLAALFVGFLPETLPTDHRPPRLIAFYIALVLSVFVLVSLYSLRASLARSNWLVRFDGSTLHIKFRSYLNRHFPPEDLVVVRIPSAEVAWIRKTRERRLLPRRRGADSQTTTTYLDVKLQDVDTADLERGLAEERRRKGPLVRRTRTKAQHYPVRLVEADILRIDWRDHRTRITPGIDAAIDLLGRRFHVADAGSLRQASVVGSTDNRQQEERLLDLVERGEVVAASLLASRLYSLSTTEAREFIAGLDRDPPAGSASNGVR